VSIDTTADAAAAVDRITGFMQAWDQGEVVAVAVSHGQGRQELRWSDLAEARAALLTARCDDVSPEILFEGRPLQRSICSKPAGHPGPHRSGDTVWTHGRSHD
jgi:hypothetical protein